MDKSFFDGALADIQSAVDKQYYPDEPVTPEARLDLMANVIRPLYNFHKRGKFSEEQFQQLLDRFNSIITEKGFTGVKVEDLSGQEVGGKEKLV